jgi:hypothetical protein
MMMKIAPQNAENYKKLRRMLNYADIGISVVAQGDAFLDFAQVRDLN